jgi:hypothetical protein
MNRYFVRSFVAILTFCIGLAVSSVFSIIPRRSKHRNWESYNCKKVFRFERKYETLESMPSPALSIDNVGTDPLKLLYARTTSNHVSFPKQTVEFLVGNNTQRTIESFTVSYRSAWSSNRYGGRGSVLVHKDAKVSTFPSRNLELVSIDCDADETLTVWIASVEFTDGTRWNNPRHPDI